MLLPILPSLLALAMLPRSFAIKCFVQPDPEKYLKLRKEVDENWRNGHPMDPEKQKQEELRVGKSVVQMDCGEHARQRGYKPEASHCFSLDQSSCPEEAAMELESKNGTKEGIFFKDCVSEEFFRKRIEIIDAIMSVTPENICKMTAKLLGCTRYRCYTCNDGDFCNASPGEEEKTSTTELTTLKATSITNVGPVENGAMLVTGEPASTLFQLLLAISTGAFSLAAFR